MHFIRLIRPLNLLVVVLTMYGIRVYFLPYLNPPIQIAHKEALDYFLLVFSTVLIAAAGNIINDYFDVKADRINKPEKVIIGKHIKPRWAIVSHWILNVIAFVIACYLSWEYDTFWYLFIHLLSINLLWFYSMYFKRRFFIGNILIAGLTGLVPILCGIHFLGLTTPYGNTNFMSHYIHQENWISQINLKIFFVLALAFFAFALNLIRELVKDIEDVSGDLLLKAKTIPIVLGLERARWISIIGLLAIMGVALPLLTEGYSVFQQTFVTYMWPALLIIFMLITSIILLLRKNDRKTYKLVNILLKLSMLIGCSLPFYWYFL